MTFPDTAVTTSLYGLAVEILANVAQRMTDPPDRRYVAMNLPAWDCEQMTIHMSSSPLTEGGLADLTGPIRCRATSKVTYVLDVVRCYPSIKSRQPPTAAELNAAAAVLLRDGEEMQRELLAMVLAKNLFVLYGCEQANIGTLVPVGPQGGWAAMRLPLTVQRPPGASTGV